MAKDQFWFKHESASQDDPRHMVMIDDLGMEGYGIYWAIKERLRGADGYVLPVSVYRYFARIWNTSHVKVQAVIEKYGLFEVNETHFFCPEMMKSMREIRQKATHAANARWDNNRAKLLEMSNSIDASALQADSNRNADGMQNDAYKIREDKKEIRKEKKRTNKTNPIPPTEESVSFVKWFLTILPEAIAQKAKTDSWHGEYLSLRKKGYSKVQIATACQWGRSDHFWKTNFYSPAKLPQKNEQGVLYIDVFLEKAEAEERKRQAAAQRKTEPAFTVPTEHYRHQFNKNA